MSKCSGCGEPLEMIAQIRVYHGQCDPRGRVEMLERELRTTLKWATKMGYRELEARLRAALAYKPAGTTP